MISRMHRIEVVGPIDMLGEAVDVIQNEGSVHLEPIPLSEYGEKQFLHRVPLSSQQAEESRLLSDLISMLEDAIDFIPSSARPDRDTPRFAEEYGRWNTESLGNILVNARSLHAKNRSFSRRRRNLGDDIQGLAVYEDVIGALVPLVESEELPAEYEFTGIILEGKSHMPLELFEEELKKLTNGEYRLITAAAGGKRTAALVGYSRRQASGVKHMLLETGIGQMSLPRYMKDSPFEQALARMQEDLSDLRTRLEKVEAQAREFYNVKAMELTAMLDVCIDRNAKFTALETMAVTRYTFLVWGWVPEQLLESLEARLLEISENSIVLREVRKPKHENPPVLLNNSRPVQQFEPLMKLFPLPKYGTVDPTSLVAMVFPAIFGLMLADVAYGIILAAIAGLLYFFKRHKKLWRQLSFVLLASAFFTIVFGFVFGEFLGEFGHNAFGLKPLWQERFSFHAANRTELLMAYMAIALAIGLFHILLGLVLGMVNSKKNGHGEHIVENLAKIVGIFMLLALVGRLAKLLPEYFTYVWLSMLVVFVGLMVAQFVKSPLQAFMLPLELLSTMGNILSYVRIMAVGLVSIVLAYLANLFGGMMGNIVAGLILAVLIHGLNLALGVIDPTIQGLRLHYVEFFSKFYIGGGTPYTPFHKVGGIR